MWRAKSDSSRHSSAARRSPPAQAVIDDGALAHKLAAAKQRHLQPATLAVRHQHADLAVADQVQLIATLAVADQRLPRPAWRCAADGGMSSSS
jgi:hypothetical protein